MFLFYSLICRNYQEYKRKPCWSRIGTFLKSVWELFTKFASLTLEDDVKWRPGCYESCHNFPYEDFKPKISPIGVRTRPVGPFWWNPKRGWRKSEKIYKGRKPNSWRTPPPTNFSHQKPRFCLPHGSHLHGGGLPRSHEGGRLRGGAPPWCRRRGSSSPHRRQRSRRPAILAALSAVFTAISITNSSLYSVVHPPTNLRTVLCKHGVWCYNIYPMIYVMFM